MFIVTEYAALNWRKRPNSNYEKNAFYGYKINAFTLCKNIQFHLLKENPLPH